MVIKHAQPYREQIIALLASQHLPVSDLPGTLDNFFAAISSETLTGVVGLEMYGEYGLLRSLAVDPSYRNSGIAGTLLQHIEMLSSDNGLKALYLLTETAASYFKRKGYAEISRLDVPREIQQSSEFAHVCPASAIVMIKTLK